MWYNDPEESKRRCVMNRGNMLRGYLHVITSAVIYGRMPLMTKFVYADAVLL